MTAIETALHARLLQQGRHIVSTVIPEGWPQVPDHELLADARFWAEQKPLKVVKA